MANQNSTPSMSLWESVLRIGVSLIFGGILYVCWLGVFLLLNTGGGMIETILWLIAPLVTGLGFGLGVYLVNKVLKKDPTPFHQITLWPILGCILGAVALYWFGPMLIVFSMLAAGTASICLREYFLHWRTLV